MLDGSPRSSGGAGRRSGSVGARGGRGGGTAGADKSKREIERDLERWVRTRFTHNTFHSYLVAFSLANRALLSLHFDTIA